MFWDNLSIKTGVLEIRLDNSDLYSFYRLVNNKWIVSYILEASVENLELPFIKVGLRFQFVQAFWSMADYSHLKVIVSII